MATSDKPAAAKKPAAKKAPVKKAAATKPAASKAAASKVSTANAALREDIDAKAWSDEVASGSGLTSKLFTEAIGTFILVLMGVGTALFATINRPDTGGLLVGLAFGVTVMALIVSVGHISGGHFNPAVTVGAWAAGRFPLKDVAFYVIAQTIGGVSAGAVLAAAAGSHPNVADVNGFMNSAAIGHSEHSPLQFGQTTGIVAEAIGTGLLVAVILAATSKKAPKGAAPVTIGLSLAVLVIAFMPFTNAGLNPARSTATALFAEPWAVSELWLWWAAPMVGAALVGLFFNAFGPLEDLDDLEGDESDAALR